MAGDFEYQWGQLVARAWNDAAFKAKLLADPANVLKENGLTPPSSLKIQVVENTDKVVYLVLPLKPAPEELSQEELHRVAGGACNRCETCGRCGANCSRCVF